MLTKLPLFCVFFVFCSLALTAAPGDVKNLVSGFVMAQAMEALPDGRVLVAQKNGQIFQVKGNDVKPWADLSSSTATEKDCGIQGIATGPHFLADGFVYVSQSFKSGDRYVLRLLRLRESAGQGVLNKVMAENIPSGTERIGGTLRVGPDQCLYWTIGDGGNAKAAQDPSLFQGSILRFDLDGSIPLDNPIGDSPVWAWGFRDPRGLAWHPVTGKMYALDCGPPVVRGTMDELNLVEKGKNYGWPLAVGRDWTEKYEMPVIYCSSGHSWVPTGAVFVTKGKWTNSILFSGKGEGILYRLALDQHSPKKINFYEELLGGDYGPLMDMARTVDGRILLLGQDKLYEVATE